MLRISLVSLLVMVMGACAQKIKGAELTRSTLPPPEAVAKALPESGSIDPVVYTKDLSFLGEPKKLIAQVYELMKDPDGKCTFKREYLRGITPGLSRTSLHYGEPTTDTPLQTILVSSQAAASISALSAVSGAMSSEDVSSLSHSIVAQRVTEDDNYNNALRTFKPAADANRCDLYIVMGYVLETYTAKVFKNNKGGASAGVYGVNVNGSYHYSGEQLVRDFRFGLSLRRLSIDPAKGPLGADEAKPLSKDEIQMWTTFLEQGPQKVLPPIAP